jgi:hypothetical protein
VFAHDPREIDRIVVSRVGSINSVKQFGDILRCLLEGRPDDMSWWLVKFTQRRDLVAG